MTELVSPTAQASQSASIGATNAASSGLKARVTSVKAITAKAKYPGEVTGPGVAVAVTIDNDTDADIPAGGITVTVTGSGDEPGNALEGPPAKPIRQVVRRGSTAQGVYVFQIAKSARKPLTISVSVDPKNPVLVFKGNVD